MKKSFFLILIFSFLSFISGYFFNLNYPKTFPAESAPKPKPFETYSIENLVISEISPSKITIDSPLKDDEKYNSSLFSMIFNPNPNLKEEKKVTGLINIPKSTNPSDKYPLILLLRGYVDQKIYEPGMGTKRAGEYFAQNGFITVAPDFLGYAGSDTEAGNIFESRFQTYVTALSVLKSLPSIKVWNGKDIFIWGHSNGGQIALTILEITGKTYPTTLWAPVSKPFPYSILYYTDESDDKGKLIRKGLSLFEEDYDVEKYSLDNYFDRIKAPIQIHQGTADDAVPQDWTKNISKKLKDLSIDTTLYIYSGADHNLNPSWNNVIERDLEFFRNFIQN